MKFYYFFRITLYTFIFLGIFNSSYSKILDFNYNAKNISNYFSGIISFDDFDYSNERNFSISLNDSGKNNSKAFVNDIFNL